MNLATELAKLKEGVFFTPSQDIYKKKFKTILKNTYLPKKSIPKIEEVREIEIEIPTYEEFLSKNK